jgi:hypothetical protein
MIYHIYDRIRRASFNFRVETIDGNAMAALIAAFGRGASPLAEK